MYIFGPVTINSLSQFVMIYSLQVVPRKALKPKVDKYKEKTHKPRKESLCTKTVDGKTQVTPIPDREGSYLPTIPSCHSVEIQTSFIDTNYQSVDSVKSNKSGQHQSEDSGDNFLDNVDTSWKDRVEPFLENNFDCKKASERIENESNEDLMLKLDSDRESLTSVHSFRSGDTGNTIETVRSGGQFSTKPFMPEVNGETDFVDKNKPKETNTVKEGKSKNDRYPSSDRSTRSYKNDKSLHSPGSVRSNDSKHLEKANRRENDAKYGTDVDQPKISLSDRSERSQRSCQSSRERSKLDTNKIERSGLDEDERSQRSGQSSRSVERSRSYKGERLSDCEDGESLRSGKSERSRSRQSLLSNMEEKALGSDRSERRRPSPGRTRSPTPADKDIVRYELLIYTFLPH